ncbi:DNA-binding protein, partial [Vibrio fluvialis]
MTMWLIASELVGMPGVPATDRNIRELLKKLAVELPEKARKREGSKATEYHISLLPAVTQTAIIKKNTVNLADKVEKQPKSKATKSYCR